MKEITMMEQETKDRISYRMPELSEDDHSWAMEHERREWAHGWMARLIDGQVHYFGENGICLQRVNENSIRVLSVVDHDWCFHSLSSMRATFEASSIEVQIDPYAILMPYTETKEDEQIEQLEAPAGVEVA
jgi:hypothetical protein